MASSSFSLAINPHPGKGEIVSLFCGSDQTDPQHEVGPQVLDYYLVHHVLSGQGRFHILGREYSLKTGDSFFIFPGELVSYVSDIRDPWRYRWIGFKGTHADQLLGQIGISPHQPVVHARHNRRVPAIFHQLEKTLSAGEKYCDLQSSGYMKLLFAEYGKDRMTAMDNETDEVYRTEIEQQVDQAIRWLTLQYTQPISIEKMAQSLGYHRTHLSKMFKQQIGISPMQFLLKIRMERAKHLLAQPLTIEQVASSVGFADALYFSKQFRKWYGRTPTEYRQTLRPQTRFDCRQ